MNIAAKPAGREEKSRSAEFKAYLDRHRIDIEYMSTPDRINVYNQFLNNQPQASGGLK